MGQPGGDLEPDVRGEGAGGGFGQPGGDGSDELTQLARELAGAPLEDEDYIDDATDESVEIHQEDQTRRAVSTIKPMLEQMGVAVSEKDTDYGDLAELAQMAMQSVSGMAGIAERLAAIIMSMGSRPGQRVTAKDLVRHAKWADKAMRD